MIQVNLLPKVKLDYVKTTRNKRVTMLVAFLSAAAAIAILVSLFVVVNVIQKKYSSDLSRDIDAETAKLQSINDLDKILTIQNQLESLGPLHEEKPVASRLLSYIEKLTPNNVAINEFNINFEEFTIEIIGEADTLKNVNEYVDTIKFTNYVVSEGQEPLPAFSEVVLSEFSKDEEGATYEITANFDQAIFASSDDVKLEVPKNKITTRSETSKPSDLFKESSNEGEL